jgi:SAM-dependent methyltransferase
MDRERLLGPGAWAWDAATRRAGAELSTRDAADLSARLRGLGFGGEAVGVDAAPPLPRPAVRAARTEDARRRRDATPGFLRPGARLDEEGRVSLTPEALALDLGRRAAARLGRDATVLDAGCGCGGNALGFARAGLRVIAVERDPERARMARHNASLYGVADRVRVEADDAVDAVGRRDADLLFVDPPWGVDWDRRRTPLDALPELARLLAAADDRFAQTWLKLPPSFDPATLPWPAEVEAVFGQAAGDARRVKFVLARRVRA